jgi:periplasmic divalent cation tolerance protein
VRVAQYFQVTTTMATQEEATGLARRAVGDRLAACGQVSGPITSVYWWDGEVTTADEWVCTFKTSAVALEPLMAALRAAHSYATPEIVATPIENGDADYLAWLEKETARPST